MAKTLEELKAENAAQEAAEAKALEKSKAKAEVKFEDEEYDEPVYEAGEDESDSKGEADSDQEGDAPTEAWMAEDSEDEQASGGDRAKFSDSDVAAAKRKLRAKLEKEHNDELEKLKAEIEQLKQSKTEPRSQDVGKVPTLEQFDYDKAKYAAAMQAWVRNQVQGASRATETEAIKQRQAQEFERKVEDHYERAAKLVKQHNIDPDLYRNAGMSLRKTIDEVFPGNGDLFTDQLLSRLGEGSEKVEYHLGRNAQKREILKAKLMEDPSGLSASIYLGKVLGEVSMPANRKSKAPAPAARANGGQGSVNNEASMKKKYIAENDVQKRFDLRRKAKLAGIDVSDW